jgi:hypothetical protein
MFLVPGVTNAVPGQTPEGYIPEAHLNEVDDKSPKKVITVTALTANYSIDGISPSAWAWNVPGSLIPDELVARRAGNVGYDDRQYFGAVFSALPQITNADPTHRQWDFLAGSQGATTVTRLAGDPEFAGYMPNLYLVGGSAENGSSDHPVEPYTFAAGNAQHVTIIDTRGDTSILPRPGQGGGTFGSVVQAIVGLDAIDNVHQDPAKQQALYLANLSQYGPVTSQTFRAPDNGKLLKSGRDFTVPLSAQESSAELAKPDVDLRTVYRGTQGRQLDVYELPTAKHLIPGPRAGTTSLLGSSKYEGFYSAQVALDDLLAQVGNQ